MTSPPLSNIVSLSAAGSNQTDVNGLINGVSYDKLIVNVWATNLREEMAKINEIVDDYPYVGMDSEFPGIVARPVGCFKTSTDYQYQTLKCNVDILKIIQLGLCFCDEQGNLAPGTCTWQFNFKFSLSEDMYAQDSIDLLAKSGIDFKEHDARGIDVLEFGELLMTSGIVLNEEVKWISFHSGYDFGYLLKILTCQPLPTAESEFFALLQLYFPCIYDIKYLMNSCQNLNGGLQKVAEQLAVIRIGPQHQAGSDSLLTSATFFKMREMFFEGAMDEEKFLGNLFGLGSYKKDRPLDVDSEEEDNSTGVDTTPAPSRTRATNPTPSPSFQPASITPSKSPPANLYMPSPSDSTSFNASTSHSTAASSFTARKTNSAISSLTNNSSYNSFNKSKTGTSNSSTSAGGADTPWWQQ